MGGGPERSARVRAHAALPAQAWIGAGSSLGSAKLGSQPSSPSSGRGASSPVGPRRLRRRVSHSGWRRSDSEFDDSAHAKAARSYATPDLLRDKVTPRPFVVFDEGRHALLAVHVVPLPPRIQHDCAPSGFSRLSPSCQEIRNEAHRLHRLCSRLFPHRLLLPGQLNAYSVANAALNMLAHKSPTTFTNDGVATAAIHSERSQTSLAEGIDKGMAKYAPHGLHFPLEAAARMMWSSFLTLEKMDAFQQICFDD
ncbi:hypothetical protein BJ912DRAFT_1067400 [Pholiota molesta]|nr:hypothetical protein BJ912DRAFT_1067400 [Pholiota molesta]